MPKSILIVDDDVATTDFLDATVRAAGYRAQVAHDGVEAIERVRRSSPDLVFLDLLLPRKDGFAVAREILAGANGSRPRIVLVSGIYKSSRYRHSTLEEIGADAYLVKPFTIAQIWAVLEEQLAGSGPEATTAVPCRASPEEALGGVSVRSRPLATVLADLYRARLTGLLFLGDEDRCDVFTIDAGRPVFVRSSDPTGRLGDRLVRDGLLEAEDLEEAVKLMADSRGKARLGEILVGLGLLDQAEMERAVREQLESRVLEAFARPELAFRFVEGPLSGPEEIRIPLAVPDLILKGIDHMPETRNFEAYLPPSAARLGLVDGGSEMAEEADLGPEVRSVLDQVDGSRTVEEVLATGGTARGETARALFALQSLGLLTCESCEPSGLPEIEAAGGEEAAQGPAGAYRLGRGRADAVEEGPGAEENLASGGSGSESETGPSVPRFLYDGLLQDREQLEETLFATCEALGLTQDRLEELCREARARLEALKVGVAQPDPGTALTLVEETVGEMDDLQEAVSRALDLVARLRCG